MPSILYLHGFLSSPQSYKARQTRAWMAEHRSEWPFLCPQLSASPVVAKRQLDQLLLQLDGEPLAVIGSSLGGFWASYVCEQRPVKTVLVNPAVSPHIKFRSLVGDPLANYHNPDDITILSEQDMQVLEACQSSEVIQPSQYWLMIQLGDKVIDIDLALTRYQDCRQLLEDGGSHEFEDFQRHLPAIADFFESQS